MAGRLLGRLLLGVLVLALSGFLTLVALWSRDPLVTPSGNAPVGLFARRQLVTREPTPQALDDLAALLNDNGVTDLYVQVGLAFDGSLPPGAFPFAEDLVDGLQSRVPRVRVQAWLAQLERAGGGRLDLDDADARARLVTSARAALTLGFDGVHYDLEPLLPDDPRLIDLLRDTARVTRPRDAVLSVALPTGGLAGVLAPSGWTADGIEDLATAADQIALTTYDSGPPVGWLYGPAVAQQVGRFAEQSEDAAVLVGVASSEGLGRGLRAVRQGLERIEPQDRERIGVAIYADWTTAPADWDTYRRLWNPRPG